MFTGIVEGLGTLLERGPLGGGAGFSFSHPGWTEGLERGASVAVDGCCLSVVASDGETFSVEATRETLARTRFGSLAAGEPVNLERPLRIGDRLGGHWLQGHVDGLVEVRRIERVQETCYLATTLPIEAREWIVPQGSVALNGVSLTVLDIGPDFFRVAIIPHTWATTNLSRLVSGARVHVEYDILAKYATAALARRLELNVPHAPPLD
ncbi:MAG TPA: riboflavin synthase [Gemmatimonadota bacterium]